jgi:hypothetical protein
VGGRGEKLEGEYYRSILHMCIKTAIPTKHYSKGGEKEGK